MHAATVQQLVLVFVHFIADLTLCISPSVLHSVTNDPYLSVHDRIEFFILGFQPSLAFQGCLDVLLSRFKPVVDATFTLCLLLAALQVRMII